MSELRQEIQEADREKERENLLIDLYYNVETGLSGIGKLYAQAKRKDPSITLAIVSKFVKRQETYQQFNKQTVKKNTVFPIHNNTQVPCSRCQMDLMDFSNEYSRVNAGHARYLFLLVDCNTRYAYGVATKTKNVVECLNAFKMILKDILRSP